MAYIDDTLLLDYQATEATNEKRIKPYGLVEMAYKSTSAVDFIPPEVKKMMADSNSTRNLQIPYMKDGDVVVTNSPGFDKIPVNLGEMGQYYFSAFDIWSGFSMLESTFEDNATDAQWYFNQQMRNVLQGMAAEKESILQTTLEAQKTQVLGFTSQASTVANDYVFNTGTDTLEIKLAAQTDTLFYKLENLMDSNDLAGDYNLVTSRGGLIMTNAETMKYGAGNTKNLEWTQNYLGFENRFESNTITSSEKWDGYLVKNGAIGMFNNYPYNFRMGKTVGESRWSIAKTEMPFIKSRPNIFTRTTAADATGLIAGSNQIMTSREEIAIWDRVYVVYPVNSDITTRVNPIVKITALNS